jgi:hypothetical protein
LTVKEWLKRGRKLDAEINQLLIAKQNAFELVCGGAVDTSAERVQSSKDNTTERNLVNYIAYEELIKCRIDELVNVKTEILEAINDIPNPTYRTLLTAYYINCKTWEQVAEDLHYSVRAIHRMHGEALRLVVAV